uniref:drebrin-like protein n=1 Tax=Styela clava TaxID=7725 RepID=UPI00193A99B5|nr:drebrin-like protein [Styela clava]
MSVSFFKHKQALINAYKEVLDEKSDTDWALFTYEGKDNELKVAGTGEDGLEELETEFNSSKIMYAFIRVKDPKTSLNKFIFLHWQGEGAPANRKGACANHVRDVERFFKGAHITINARNEDDVTPEQIMEHINRASASTYAFDKTKGSYDDPSEPVGSVYKKINPGAEISSKRNENYWEKQEREEEQRKKQELRKAQEEKNRYAQEVREREKESSMRRQNWEKEREKEISEKVRAAKLTDDTADVRKREKEKWEAEQREFEAHEERGRKRSESIEKAAEAAHLVQQRDTNMRALWEQKINEATPSSQPVIQRQPSKQGERPIETYQPADVEEPEYETFEEETRNNDNNIVDNKQEPTKYDAEANKSGYSARAIYDYQAVDETEISFDPNDIITDIEDMDEAWGRGVAPDGRSGLFPLNYVERLESAPEAAGGHKTSDNVYDAVGHNQQDEGQGAQDNIYDAVGENPGESNDEDIKSPHSARALYDYQAADDSEITFDPDDIITNIEMIDEGWWRGSTPDGKYGLFPANYVELITE